MTTFDKREKALENKFFHDEELKFKTISRRRKMLGLWAAEQMHMEEEDSLKYAIDIVRLGIQDHQGGAVVKKIVSDIAERGLDIGEKRVREKMGELHKIADEHIRKHFSTK